MVLLKQTLAISRLLKLSFLAVEKKSHGSQSLRACMHLPRNMASLLIIVAGREVAALA